MFDRPATKLDTNESVMELSACKQKQYNTILPNKVALFLRIQGAEYLGRHIWGQAVVTHEQHLPSLCDWGGLRSG